MLETTVKVHDEVLKLKLARAIPNLLANNRALATSMLEAAKPMVISGTPLGPAHFGYHGRDTVKVEVTSVGMRTKGYLKAAVQLYWREYGTKGRSRKQGKALGLSIGELSRAFEFGALGDGGERAFMVAHKALAATRRFIKFYYGGMANWWKL